MAALVVLYCGEEYCIPVELVAAMQGPAPPERFRTNGAGPERLGPGKIGRALGRTATLLVPKGWRGVSYTGPTSYHDFAYATGGGPTGTLYAASGLWAHRRDPPAADA